MIHNLLIALVITFFIQIIFFIVASSFKTDKVTDLSYGLTFITIALIFLAKSAQNPVHFLIAGLVLVWAIRLTGYLFIRILKTTKDERFENIRTNFAKLAKFWFFQALAVWIIMLPTLTVLNLETTLFGTISKIGLFMWLVGFAVEAIADQQKFNFRTKEANKDKWINTGLWKFSRHPNYFGEILVWWGIFLLIVPYLKNLQLLTIFGPIFITFILLFVSGIPPLEKKSDEKFKNNRNYQQYKKKTSLLIPLPNKQQQNF